jgi:hypothetical protein
MLCFGLQLKREQTSAGPGRALPRFKRNAMLKNLRSGFCSVLLILIGVPAAADWLVTREGSRIETRGAWKIKNQLVVFTLPSGELSSLRLSEVDLAASEAATEVAKAPPEAAVAESRKPRLVVTNETVRPQGEPVEPEKPGTYTVPGHGQLQFAVPAGWTSEVRRAPSGHPTFAFQPGSDPGIKLLVTVMWSPTGDPSFNTAESIRDIVTTVGNRLLPTAVEKAINLREIRTRSGIGYWFSLTDRAPKPGEFEYMAQGCVPAGDLLLTFTVLTRTAPPQGAQEGLALVASAVQIQAPGQASAGSTP